MHGQPERSADIGSGKAHHLRTEGLAAVNHAPPHAGHRGTAGTPIMDLLRAAARGHGDRPAVVDGSGAGYSYANLLWAVEAGAEWFRSVGPRPPVLCVAGSTPDDVVAVLAAITGGCDPLVADGGWGDRYARMAADTGAGMILTAEPAAVLPPAQSFSPWPGLRWADLTRTPLPALTPAAVLAATPVPVVTSVPMVTSVPVVTSVPMATSVPMDHLHGSIGQMVHPPESGCGGEPGCGGELGCGAGVGYGRFVRDGAGGARCLRFTEVAAVAAGRVWRRATGLAVADVVLCRGGPGGGPEFDTRLFGVLDAGATLLLGSGPTGSGPTGRRSAGSGAGVRNGSDGCDGGGAGAPDRA